MRAPADGYTLLLIAPGNVINPTLYDKLNFNFISDIAPVASISRAANVIMANPSFQSPSSSPMPRPTPASSNYGSAGIGTSTHVSAELFKIMAGVDLVHVP
jgi:tripartite-type tricarboxylate transporter receptor subunit TctC